MAYVTEQNNVSTYNKHANGQPYWVTIQGLYSLGGKTSYCQILWSLEALRLDFMMIISL